MACATLEPCVALALEVIALPQLRAWCDALMAQKAIVDAEILRRQAQLLKYDFLAAGVDVAAAAAKAFLDQVEEGLNAYPNIANFGNVVSECLRLGIVITSPQETFATIREVTEALLRRARELASFSEELGEIVNQLQELSQLLSNMCDCIDEIIVQRESPPAAA